MFEMLPYALRAVLVLLATGLKILLAILPGLMLYIGSIILMVSTNLSFFGTVGMVGFFSMYPMAVMAILRCRLAFFVLADAPETGAFACVNRSCELMEGRKAKLFSLVMFYLILNVLIIIFFG